MWLVCREGLSVTPRRSLLTPSMIGTLSWRGSYSYQLLTEHSIQRHSEPSARDVSGILVEGDRGFAGIVVSRLELRS